MLTFLQIWGTVEQGDIGCSRGGGKNAKAVFSDAGLHYSSSTGFKTDTRQGNYLSFYNILQKQRLFFRCKQYVELTLICMLFTCCCYQVKADSYKTQIKQKDQWLNIRMFFCSPLVSPAVPQQCQKEALCWTVAAQSSAGWVQWVNELVWFATEEKKNNTTSCKIIVIAFLHIE